MEFLARLLRSPHVVGLLVALVAFVVYLRTLAPSVDFIDAGELSADVWTLGIAHPTGYPLFTLLGWLFAHLPVHPEPVVRLNIMAALLCSVGVFVFFHVVRLIVRKFFRITTGLSEDLLLAVCAAASLLQAFSETYWSQAVAVEVYSLHMLLVGVVLYSFLRANIGQGNSEPTRDASAFASSTGWWMLFAFTLGLSFTNHMTTILLAPGFLYLYFAQQGWSGGSWKRIGTMVLPFLLGLSAYFYLPVRAAQSPVLDWGNPVTFERFLWHISGKQFRVWIFSSTEVAGRQLTYFINSLPAEHAYVGGVLAVIGAVALWRRTRRIFIFTAVLFVTCVGYAINYDIHDIDSYFLLAYTMIALWAGCGLFMVGTWSRNRFSQKSVGIVAIVLVISLVPLMFHYRASDESSNYLVEDYTLNMFASLRPDAIVLSFQWDYWVSASYYEQLVKGVRPDVIVIDKELLRRSWYITQLEHRYPWLMDQSRAEVVAYLRELQKFEHELPYDPATIQARYVALIGSLISMNISSRPVYVTQEIEPEFTRGLQRVPEGLAQRLVADSLFHPTTLPAFTYRPFDRKGRLEDMTRQLYAEALTYRGRYYLQWGDRGEAERAFKMALSFSPAFTPARQWLGTILSRTR
jgi:hypothetical protein